MIIIQPTILLFLSYFLTIRIAKYFKVNQITITAVFILKTIISLYYIPIAKNADIDAYGYFEYALGNFKAPYFAFYGTDLLFHFSYFLRVYLNFDIVSMTFLYSFIGNIGTIIFASNIRDLTKNADNNLKLISQLIIFFPTLNLHISSIGKDAITFTCINLIIYCFINMRSRILILISSMLLFAIIRPINGIILFLAFLFSQISKNNLKIFQKIIIGIITFTGLIFFNANVADRMPYLSLGDFDLNGLKEAIIFYQNITMDGNNAIDLGSLPFPLKVFTFMFRPLFFDIRDIYTLVMSFENLIILYIFLYPILKIIKNKKIKNIKLDSVSLFLLTYLSINWIFYSLTIANIGTANRYKIMFLPALISLSLITSQKLNKKNLKEIS